MIPKPPLLINTQFVLFFAQPLEKPETLWKNMDGTELASVFDQTPTIQPVPLQANLAEVPVVQVLSSQGHALSIARARADFTFVTQHGNTDGNANLQQLLLAFFTFVDQQALIRRIGYVKRYFFETEDPAKLLSGLLKKQPTDLFGGALHDLFLRFTVRDTVGKFAVNNFTNLEPATANGSNGQTMQGVLVTRDINTAAEENYLFDKEILQTTLGGMEKKLQPDDVLKLLGSV